MRRGRLVDRTPDKVVAGLLVIGFFVYLLTRPTLRLRVDLPPDFLAASDSSPQEKQATEEKVARAYWYCVVTVIQRKYKFGDPLPLNPPPEFRIIMPNLPKGAADPDTRLRYWHRLQHIWYLPSTWRKESGWDLHWLTDWMYSSAPASQ